MADTEPAPDYTAAIGRAFRFARATSCGCRPVHFLVGIAEGDDPAAAALTPPSGQSLRAVVTGMSIIEGGLPGSYLHLQAQGSARSLAAQRNEPAGPAHLLVALLDQGTPEVLEALRRAGLDRAVVRRSALAALGGPADQPVIALAPLTPAGTLDRLPLPVASLDPAAWQELCWRQERLPLSRLHGRWDVSALQHLEDGVVLRLADRRDLDEDQRHSLLHHHHNAVADKIAQVRPPLAPPRLGPRPGGQATARAVAVSRGSLPRRLRPPRGPLRLTVGWGAWFSNRRMWLWDRWFALRALGACHGAPAR